MTPDVVAVTPLSDYCLETLFENGERRWFDMKPLLGYPAFAPLTEQNLFMKAHAKNGTVVWTDEIDLSPDTLYLRGCPLTELEAEALLAETRKVSGKRSLDEIDALIATQRKLDWEQEEQ